jgi:hypothetical protein
VIRDPKKKLLFKSRQRAIELLVDQALTCPRKYLPFGSGVLSKIE